MGRDAAGRLLPGVKLEVSRVKVALKILLGDFGTGKRIFVRLNGNKAVVGVGPEELDDDREPRMCPSHVSLPDNPPDSA
jgi:hypothetical protein